VSGQVCEGSGLLIAGVGKVSVVVGVKVGSWQWRRGIEWDTWMRPGMGGALKNYDGDLRHIACIIGLLTLRPTLQFVSLCLFFYPQREWEERPGEECGEC
jgi:hypothetical protein